MQTILGSGGAIGIELAKALKVYTNDIRLVSRNPEKVNETDELFAADLLNPNELENAVKGSDIVYVTVGFPYSYKVWREKWPKFIDNLLRICEKEACKLVFFDNVYMYDKENLSPMTENTPVNPPSKKGEIRADISRRIMENVEAGKIKALIARSADFYGPSIKNSSILTETVFKPLSKAKTANWLANDMCKHSFTYTPDAGRATALLGNTEKAYGQIWHLPTASNPFTGKEWIETIAKKMNVKPKYRVVSNFMVRLIGVFVPVMKESVEMLYQYDRDYIFDSSKFEKEFDLMPTSYEDGITEIIETDYKEIIVNN
ncbi:MAG: NAD-dependent epimerase/dehydratase family protein [Bacteroidota bacterium]